MADKSIFEKLGIDIKVKNSKEMGVLKSFNRIYQKTMKKYKSPETVEYFHNLVSAIMIDFEKVYEDSDVKTLYRTKAPKSLIDKILEYMVRPDKADFNYNDTEGFSSKLKEEIHDMLAITMVLGYRPPTFASKDPKIQDLIQKKNESNFFIGEMQNFRLKLVEEEFPGTDKIKYKYDCTKGEYYDNCIAVAKKIKEQVNPKATKRIEKYNKIISAIENKKESLGEIGLKEKITESTIKEIDFTRLYKSYKNEIYDNIDLNIFTKQIKSVLSKSAVLKRLGVSIDEKSYKETRTARGFASNFIYLVTPLGKVELQVQTRNQNRQASYGYAAHYDMNDEKSIKPFELPDENDRNAIEKFKTSVEMVSPQKYVAEFDDAEPGRIIIHEYGEYQNYKSLMSQVKRGTKTDLKMKQYFEKLYEIKDKIFTKNDKIKSFIEYDIKQYLRSDKYKDILKISKNKENEAR